MECGIDPTPKATPTMNLKRAEANKNGKAMWWINEPLLAAETLELAICLFAKKLFSK